MMKHLESRKEEIARAYSTVDQTRREMDNLRSEYQGRLAEIEAEPGPYTGNRFGCPAPAGKDDLRRACPGGSDDQGRRGRR